jgi:Laminin G domain
MHKPGIAAIATTMVATGTLALAPLSAQAATTVALWNMNEGAGATVMTDNSGQGLNGSIGSDVVPGTSTDTGRGYRFPAPPDRGKHDSHLAVVPDSPALDPGTGNLSVTVRLRTGAGNQNIVQKGQANISGGYYKIDMVQGVPICLFRDINNATSAKKWTKPIWDGHFHTIRCARQGKVVSISVDGAPARTNVRAIGSVANSKSLSIGGKLYCNPPAVGCDYFVGAIDSVEIAAS